MGQCGLSDYKSKSEGDVVYWTDRAHCGRKGVVLEGTDGNRPGTITVQWDDDDGEQRISSMSVTKELDRNY